MSGINRHMGPVKTQYMQTYVDQYVPMPFETMEKSLDRKQVVHDQTKSKADAILSAHVNAISGDDEALRDESLAKYSSKIEGLVDEAGGDWGKLRSDIGGLTTELDQDMKRGDLANIQQRYNSWQADNASVDKGVALGHDEGGFVKSYGDIAKQKTYDDYYARGGARGGANYGASKTAGTYDWDRIIGEKAKEIKADTAAWAKAGYEPGQIQSTSDGFVYVSSSGSREDVPASVVKQVAQGVLSRDPRFAEEMGFRSHIGQKDDYLESFTQGLIQDTEDTYSYNKDTIKKGLKFGPTGSGSGLSDARGSGLTAPIEGRPIGAVDTVDAPSLENAMGAMENSFVTEARKLQADFGLSDVVMGDYESASNALNDPNTRKQVIAKGGTTALNKLEYMNQQLGLLEKRDELASRAATERVGNVVANFTEPVKDELAVLGWSDEDYVSLADAPGANVNPGLTNIGKLYETVFNEKYNENEIPPYEVEELVKDANPEAYQSYINLMNNVSNFEDVAGAWSDAKNNYLKETGKGQIKTQAGVTKVPMYAYDPTTNSMVFDEAGSNKLTKELRGYLSDLPSLMTVNAEFRLPDGPKTMTVKEYLDATLGEEYSMSDVKVGKFPLVGKTLNSKGEDFVSVSINGSEAHIPINETQFTEVAEGINTPVAMTLGTGEKTYVNPRKVDNYILSMHNAAVLEQDITYGGETIKVRIPKNIDAKTQQGTSTFYNNSNLVIEDGDNRYEGSAAYKILLSLQAEGIIK